MPAEIPSATPAGEPTRLQPRDRARHQRATKRLRQTKETQKFGEHRPPWPESWQTRAWRGHPQLSQRELSYCCFEYFMTAYTSRNRATSVHRRGTASESTDAGKPGTLLPCRTCSASGRKYKTSGRPCGPTNRKAGIECEGLTGQGASLDRPRDPKRRTIWRTHSRRTTSTAIMAQSDGPTESSLSAAVNSQLIQPATCR